jgi:protein-S-isoprenylcysteine O-methyltransferase
MATPSSLSPQSIDSRLSGDAEDDDEVSWATGRDGRRASFAKTLSISTRLEPKPSISLLEPRANLLPVHSPIAQWAAESPDRPYFPGQPKSLAGIAIRAFALGSALTLGVLLTVLTLACTTSPLWRLPFFLAALSAFHFLEFWTTAAYNTPQAGVDAFLLSANGPGYVIAHSAASLECLVTNIAFPGRSWAPLHIGPLLPLLGLVLVVAGQVVRSAAMKTAGQSFNHQVQRHRAAKHTLVTEGIYAKLRHPSYFGFFWWAMGTQLVLGNVVCFVAYALVLWRFFSTRIRHEEELLVSFFGEEYVNYRKKTGTKLPFIP